MTDKLLNALNKKVCSASQLKWLMKETGYSKEMLKSELKRLIKEDIIYKNHFGNYCVLKTGILSVKNPNFGFILPIESENSDVDYFVAAPDMLNARDGDKVLFYVFTSKSGKKAAEIVKIVEQKTPYLVGLLQENPSKKGTYYVIPKDPNDLLIVLYKDNLNCAMPDMYVKVKVLYRKYGIKGEVVEILGHKDDPGIEISTIASIYGFTASFNDDVKEEVKFIPQELESSDYVGRVDYRNLNLITIDGDDSKDFDDAVFVEKIGDKYRLIVAIADVSSYVKFNSALDQEAYKRGTSVYLADRVIPMLPHELSNGICSLNEGVDRKVLAVDCLIDQKGNFFDYKIQEAIICSKHRMTYNKCNKMLEGDSKLINEYNDIYQMLLDMNDLHRILRKKRDRKGGLEFETNEYRFSLDENGKPISITLRTRDEAEKIIEDFMILANEIVAYNLSMLNYPCLFRVHEQPEQDKLRQVLLMIRNMGIPIKISRNDIHPKQVQDALEQISDSPKEQILNTLLLRSMMKAKYQPQNIGHYGLALQYYCHFTSPIRRYPDLIVHRIIKELIIHPKNFEQAFNYYVANLNEIGLKTSNQERKSIECERTVNDMLSAWYMEDHIGESFKCIITSITKFGMFVTTDEGIEGLVHIKTLDGVYNFNEDSMTLSNGVTTYNLGDEVKVKLVSASRLNQMVDFIIDNEVKNESNCD